MDPATHKYTPLDRESSEIRLFSFEQGTDGKIVGQHHVFPISKCPKFIALSYTWGTPGSETIISLDGSDFSIRHNLNEALESIIRLRVHYRVIPNVQTHGLYTMDDYSGAPKLSIRTWEDSPRRFTYNGPLHPQNRLTDPCDEAARCQYFWIDSICIDQQDLLERNHQVGLMKNIYSDADSVITWLGPQDGVYRNIRMEDIALSGKDVQLRLPLLPEFLLYIGGLKSCVYWRRLWIVQEIVLARDILVGWGDDFFSWKDLEVIAERMAFGGSMNKVKKERMDPLGRKIYDQAEWMTLVEQRLRWRENMKKTVPLSSLIQQFARQECTDVRDKVIGLLGLAPGDVTHLADYSLPLEDFFSAVCQYVFTEPNMTIKASQLGFQGFLGANLGIPIGVRRKPIRYISLDR